MINLSAYELRILQEVAGQRDPSPWGSGVGQALEVLSSSGYITRKFGGEITEKGRQALACALAMNISERVSTQSLPFGTVTFTYINHRGEEALRTVRPVSVSYLTEPGYGYAPGWFLIGHDLDKQAERIFSLSNIQTAGQELHLRW